MARPFYARGCGCAPAGLLALLKRARRDQSKVQPTKVGAYVARKSKPLTRKVARTLTAQGSAIAAKASKLYATRLAKDERPQRDTIAAILSELGIDDMGEEIAGQLAGAMLAAFRRAAVQGAEDVGFDTGGITDQVDDAAVAYADDRGGELITDLAGTTDDDMRALLGRAVAEGMSPDDLSDAIEESGSFSESRADMIARTELAFAHVQGNIAGWKLSGQVSGKRAILGDNHDIEDECDEAADMGVVDLDDDFGDLGDPPFHPYCVCDVEAVLSDDSDDDSSSSDDSDAGGDSDDDTEKVDLAQLLGKGIDQAAHSAATSDLNLLRKPTEAQAKAGNYKKGRARIAGLPLTIENPAGSKRRPEWPPLSAHYGYVRGTEGADGDHVDVFVRPSTADDWDGTVFVIDQTNADGTFDEHKCMLGFDDETQAVRAYSANYPDGWKVGPVTAMTCEAFREWLASGVTDRPVSETEAADA